MNRVDSGTLCFQESQRDLRYVGWIGKKILRKGWSYGKKYPWAESEICMNVFVWEKKNIFFKVYKKM